MGPVFCQYLVVKDMLGLSPKTVPMPIFARGDLHSSLPVALDTRPLYAQFGVVEGGAVRASVSSRPRSTTGPRPTTTGRSLRAILTIDPEKKAENEMASRAALTFPFSLSSPRGVNKLGGERGCRIILRYAHERAGLETPDLWKEGCCCLN